MVVTSNVTVDPNSTLVAAFARNADGPGISSLTVHGNVLVRGGGTLVLGCEASASPCVDDHAKTPTLNSADFVGGASLPPNPLGVLVHNSTIVGDAMQSGGGGGAFSGPGAGCTPTGVFAALFQSPVFSDYEDNTIGGNLWVTNFQSCWFGALRDQVAGMST